MTHVTLPYIERTVARCRVILSLMAMAALSIDPTRPMLSGPVLRSTGHALIDPYTLALMTLHLVYSVTIYYLLTRQFLSAARGAAVTAWLDVLFGAAIVLVAEGAGSPFYVFFGFAVAAAGF